MSNLVCVALQVMNYLLVYYVPNMSITCLWSLPLPSLWSHLALKLLEWKAPLVESLIVV